MFRVCWFGQLKGILYPSEGKGNPKIWILPHFISPQKMIFFSIFYQFWSWLTFFIDKLYFQRVWFPLHGFWNKSHDFVGNVNNGFSLKKTSKWRHKYAHHTSNNSSLTSKSDVVTDCLARSVRKLWPIITSKGKTVSLRALKGWKRVYASLNKAAICTACGFNYQTIIIILKKEETVTHKEVPALCMGDNFSFSNDQRKEITADDNSMQSTSFPRLWNTVNAVLLNLQYTKPVELIQPSKITIAIAQWKSTNNAR